MKTIQILILALLAAVMTVTIVLWMGTYNVAADTPHWAMTHEVMEFARERSISHRIDDLQAPDLADAARISSGAGNYDAMCTGCHLKPGIARSEIADALYPTPGSLTAARNSDPRRDFWIIKHGLKMSGMPAWGKSMEDDYIWGMVAFLQRLPEQTPESYASMIAASAGHQHGGGEGSEAAAGHDDGHSHGQDDEQGHGQENDHGGYDDHGEAHPAVNVPAASPAEPPHSGHEHAHGGHH